MCSEPQYNMRFQDALERYKITSPSTLSRRAKKLGIQPKKINNINWFTVIDTLILDAYDEFLKKTKNLKEVGVETFKNTEEYKEIVSLLVKPPIAPDPWLNDGSAGVSAESGKMLNTIKALEEKLAKAEQEIALLRKKEKALVKFSEWASERVKLLEKNS